MTDYSKNARMVLEKMSTDTCWKLTEGYASDIVTNGLPTSVFNGALDTVVKGEDQAVVGEMTIWGDESGTTAKLSLQVRIPVRVTGPGKHDFTFLSTDSAIVFQQQHDNSEAAVKYFATTELPDKLEGKTGLKCKAAKPAKKADLMFADKASDKPRVMPTEWKITYVGDAIPSPESPADGFYVLKYPFDLEPKGKTLKSSDNFDPALLPECGAKDYLIGKGLPCREYKCMIGDHPVSVATLLTEMQVKPDLWVGFGKVRAANCYYYSDKYNRITHGPWVDRVTLFALAERSGSASSCPDIDMSNKLHIYMGAGSKRKRTAGNDSEQSAPQRACLDSQ